MKTSTDLSTVSHTYTAAELVAANIPFVQGVIYQCELNEARYVTPKHTFKGWCCDCWPLVKRGGGFALAPGFESPIPVKSDYLGEVVGVITSGFPSE